MAFCNGPPANRRSFPRQRERRESGRPSGVPPAQGDECRQCRHPRESGGPRSSGENWIPAFAGMTGIGDLRECRRGRRKPSAPSRESWGLGSSGENWIPAFAGMTGIGDLRECRPGRRKPSATSFPRKRESTSFPRRRRDPGPFRLTNSDFPASMIVGRCGPVAQLGEHMVCNHGVGSSNLPRSTKHPAIAGVTNY